MELRFWVTGPSSHAKESVPDEKPPSTLVRVMDASTPPYTEALVELLVMLSGCETTKLSVDVRVCSPLRIELTVTV
jgi:hypothetical protein